MCNERYTSDSTGYRFSTTDERWRRVLIGADHDEFAVIAPTGDSVHGSTG